MQEHLPQRIVCLTDETTELIYLLGEQDKIVGISGFSVRPPEARKQKPKVSAFTKAKMHKILDLRPDLVLGFSDMQADIAADLVREGIAVHIFNQRSIAEIFNMMILVGAMLGVQDKAIKLVDKYKNKINALRLKVENYIKKPVVYFEEWYEPTISGIQWVAEFIEIAGGIDCFPEYSQQASAKKRIIENDQQIINKNPDIIIGSWCGRKFIPEKITQRKGWESISAVKNNQIFEIKSSYILQPGPAAFSDGLDQLDKIISNWVKKGS